jgi:hypothetical protein
MEVNLMKAKLSLLLTAFALVLTVAQSQPARFEQGISSQQCSSYCSRVRCIGDYICGLYTNSSGQTVCGCHPRPF